MYNINTIHIRNSATHLTFHFFYSVPSLHASQKASPAWLFTFNELMVDPSDDPLVTMDEMEASILNLLVVSSEIVPSSADFSRLFLFHSFRYERPLCRVL